MLHHSSTSARNSPLRVPGYLSIRAAAEALGIGERSVLELVERQRLTSARLGRIHFIPIGLVREYGAERRLRRRRSGKGNRGPAQHTSGRQPAV